MLLIPFICFLNRTFEGDDGEGYGGSGGGDVDDEDLDGVGGRPWRILGEEPEAGDLQKNEEILGENMGEFSAVTAQDMFDSSLLGWRSSP